MRDGSEGWWLKEEVAEPKDESGLAGAVPTDALRMCGGILVEVAMS